MEQLIWLVKGAVSFLKNSNNFVVRLKLTLKLIEIKLNFKINFMHSRAFIYQAIFGNWINLDESQSASTREKNGNMCWLCNILLSSVALVLW